MNESTLWSLGDLSPADALRVERACSRFEKAWQEWRGGPRPDLRQALGEADGRSRAVLLVELLRLELAYRRQAGERPALAEYLPRFPGEEGLLRHGFVGTADPRDAASAPQAPTQLPAPASLPERLRQPAGNVSVTKAQPAPARREPPPAVEAMSVEESCVPGLEDLTKIKQLGSYRILKTLGAGGMGMVFQAEDVQLKRLVALKVMRPALASNDLALRRFLREARAAAAVKHDHIVTIYQVGEDQDMPYLAMEFLEGESLDDRLKREEAAFRACQAADPGHAGSPLPLAEALRIAREIAEGLAAAHQHGLIHRDVKPANIWLETMESIRPPAPRTSGDAVLLGQAPEGGDGNTIELPKRSFTVGVALGRVKILDFGLARANDDAPLTRTGAILGTPAYMSPEQANGDKIDHRCDLFSLGCVLYRMCTGRMAFTGSTTTGILMGIIRNQPKPPRELNPELPPAVNNLVMRLLAKNADDRPSSAHAVVKAIKAIEWELASVQGKQATAAASPTQLTLTATQEIGQTATVGPLVPAPPVPTRGLSSRRRWLLTAAAAFLFAVVCLAAVITLRTKNGTLVVSVTEPDVQVLVDGEEKLVIDSKKVGRVELIPGEHKLTVKRGAEELFTDSFSLKSGGEVVIDAKWTPKPPQVATGVDEARPKPVPAMTADEQVKAVADELRKRNPGFDGKVTPTVENGVVVGLAFVTDEVTDIAPVRALVGLRTLICSGHAEGKGRLADLSPLKDMKLTELRCHETQVSDLSPLKDMKLTFLDCSQTKVSDLSPLKDMKLTLLWCAATPVSDLSPLKDMKLTNLGCEYTQVSDLSPLKDMKLTGLACTRTRVSDLSPLKDMKLGELYCWGTKVSDLSPLREMKLTKLDFSGTQVSDLSPLKDMKLVDLGCWGTKVSNLSPLKDMKLTSLNCVGSPVSDLSPLKDMKLQNLNCDFHPWRDTELLRSITTLTEINSKPAADFWKEVDAQRAEFEAWCKQVAAMKPDEQVEAVKAELKKRNPGFDGKVTPTIENGVVVGLKFVTDEVTDIAPVRALAGLRTLHCGNPWGTRNGRLIDLSPLKDMKLTTLHCSATQVTDLSPLKDMKLTELWCASTAVSDLSPLKDMKLTDLRCVSTAVSDLSPLKDMKLTYLNCGETQVSDLSPLKDMKLQNVNCDFHPWRDTELLRSITTLTEINGKPAADFWKEVDAQRTVFDAWCKQVAAMKPDEQVEAVKAELKKRNPGFDGKVAPTVENGVVVGLMFVTDNVTDLAPVRALAGLRTLTIYGSGNYWEKKGKLADLSPLKEMKLTNLICDGTQVSDLSPLKDMKLTDLRCGGTRVSDLSPLKDMKLWELRCSASPVSDLSPLKDMKLTTLVCGDTKVSDLSPLKDMKLTTLWCYNTKVSDLSPLKDMKLTTLSCVGTPVSDLSPLKGMPLTELHCDNAQVSDLSPLKDMKLTTLSCGGTPVSDLSPLKDMKLQNLNCDFHPWRDTELLRSITTLTVIQDKPAADFWKEVGAQRAEFDAWCKQVAAMTADEQVKAVADELKKRNPGFDGKVTPTIENGVVVGLAFVTDEVTDIAPVRALAGLRTLKCAGSDWGKGRLADLSPLKDMKLTLLYCWNTPVSDLSPLKDLKLTLLKCGWTTVSDLSPLKDMKLTVLDFNHTPVSDLSPLKDMKLTELHCAATQVSDLSPLKDMKLTSLVCDSTMVSDLSPLKDMKLTSLWCAYTQVSDLSPLKDMKLTALWCNSTQVTDLSPLKDMPLTELCIGHTPVGDLAPLRSMPLQKLYCDNTLVSDLSPLQGAPLVELLCYSTPVSSLAPLIGMPLRKLQCDFIPGRDAALLRSIKTLETINGQPAAEFWKTSWLEARQTLTGHTNHVWWVVFTRDGATLASSAEDGTVRLWDMPGGKLRRVIQASTQTIDCADFDPTGRVLATGGGDTLVRLWDPAGGVEQATLPGHTSWVSGVAFSPDGHTLATSSSDKTVKLWDPVGRKEIKTLAGHTDVVSSVAWSPDGKVVAASAGDGFVRLWVAETGKVLRAWQAHPRRIEVLAFAPDGRTLATASHDQTVKVWDTSGKLLLTLAGHSAEVKAVAFSPDGKVLASGSKDRTARLWDAGSGLELARLAGHTDQIFALAFSPDGRTLATASFDNTVKLWNVTPSGFRPLTVPDAK